MMEMLNHYNRTDIHLLYDLLHQHELNRGILFIEKSDGTKFRLKTDEELYATLETPKSGGSYGRVGGSPYNRRITWSSYYNQANWLIFTVGIEEMPLYINDDVLCVIAAWRLRIAR